MIAQCGQQVHFRSPHGATTAGISVIHQELSLVPSMSVVDNIFLGHERRGLGGWMALGAQRRECRGMLKTLALDGEEVPKNVVLNSRVFTPENIAQGGEALIFTEE